MAWRYLTTRRKVALAAVGMAIVLPFVSMATAQAHRRPEPRPLGVPGHWRLIRTWRGHQMVTWRHTLFGDQCLTRGHIRVTRSGNLALTTNGEVNNCAEVSSRRSIVPGEVIQAEIRWPVNTTGSIMNWPAFWITTPTWRIWPVDGEIDVAEWWPGVGVCTSYHYSATGVPGFAGEASAQSFCKPVPVTPGWHVYSVEWLPTSLKYYYDGKLLGTVTGSYIADKPLSVLFDNTTGWPGGQGPSTVLVSRTRVWKHA